MLNLPPSGAGAIPIGAGVGVTSGDFASPLSKSVPRGASNMIELTFRSDDGPIVIQLCAPVATPEAEWPWAVEVRLDGRPETDTAAPWDLHAGMRDVGCEGLDRRRHAQDRAHLSVIPGLKRPRARTLPEHTRPPPRLSPWRG